MLKIISNNLFKGDKVIWMVFFFLCMISLVEIYSASSSLTYNQGNHWDPMLRQAGFLFVGLIIILITHRIPCKFFKLFPIFLLPTSIILLIYVLFFGGTINGGNRWIELGFLSFQPSEIAKAALIMTLAVILSKTQNEEKIITHNGDRKTVIRATKGGYTKAFKFCGGLTLLVCALIFTENFSTAAILFLVAVIMMFIGNVPLKLLGKGLLTLGCLGAIAVTTLLITPDATLGKMGGRPLTWKHRIEKKFVKSNADKDLLEDFDENRQEYDANIAIANSKVIGLGPGNSVQRDFLSHAESDFIYSIIIEETGLAGGIFVIFLYVILLIRASKIAQKCDRFFPAFLVMGLSIMLVTQAFVNMGVAVGMLPVTGQPLPLISKGGTSIIITCFYFGVILSISRYADKVSENAEEPVEAISANETDEYFSSAGLE
ncbi:MAG: FtsW/RodA/SpoVE family cell cycle protein [Bacteroidaceae bacterium]|nr:FtsW/RodA/SpoVE family cell cycle protein [Bacteroidaceae bacterium]